MINDGILRNSLNNEDLIKFINRIKIRYEPDEAITTLFNTALTQNLNTDIFNNYLQYNEIKHNLDIYDASTLKHIYTTDVFKLDTEDNSTLKNVTSTDAKKIKNDLLKQIKQEG